MKKTNIGILAGISAFVAYEIIKRSRKMSMKGKSILITGGSRGLGLVLARQLVRKGAKVAICARDQHELDKAAEQIRSLGGVVATYCCDVSDRAAVEVMVREASAAFGKIDILINNAGIIQVGPSALMRAEEYEEALNIILWGAINTTLAVMPQMKARRSGTIVNITSIGGKVSIPHLLPYSVSKFALVGFSEGLHAALKKDNIHVTTVFPGLMRTGSHHNIEVLGQKEKEFGWFSILGTHPLLSVNAERAAASIIKAFRQRKAAITISLPAKILIQLHALFPEFIAEASGLVNYLMPNAKGTKGDKSKGYESYSRLTPSILTTLGDKAAAINNEF